MNSAAPHHMSDLGRRVEARRARLGPSREEVAARAGSTPGYIDLLEEQLPSPGIEFLVRLANALETTVQDLTGRRDRASFTLDNWQMGFVREIMRGAGAAAGRRLLERECVSHGR
ncbi:helix-turn-helix domain-containing protein [Streptomyces sp. NPDC003327]